MISKIKKNKELLSYIEDTCCENGICVSFESSISKDDYVIIKVDKYYNSQNLANTPASVDCLIIQKCETVDSYSLVLAELKNIRNTGFEIKNMREKFETTLNNFISNKFSEHLNLNYKSVKLYFVSKNEIYKRDVSLKLDVLMGIRFKFQNKNILIQPKMPNPTLKKCY